MESSMKGLMAIYLLLFSNANAKVNENYDFTKASDCVYTGKFSKVEGVKFEGNELAPYGLAIGKFEVSKVEKNTHYLCESYKDGLDVLFSTGKGKKIVTFENCSVPKLGVKYRIGLRLVMDGTFISVGCPNWFQEIK